MLRAYNPNQRRAVAAALLGALARDPEVRGWVQQQVRRGGGLLYNRVWYTYRQAREALQRYWRQQDRGDQIQTPRIPRARDEFLNTEPPRTIPRMSNRWRDNIRTGRDLVVMGQEKRRKSTSLLNRKLTPLQKLLMLQKANQNVLTVRYQMMSAYNATAGAKDLGLYGFTAGTAGFTAKALPMYCWNLTSIPFTRALGNWKSTIPCYRLLRYDTAGTRTVAGVTTYTVAANEYHWEAQPQINGDEKGTQGYYNWNIEFDQLATSPAIQTQRWFVEWAKPKISFTGAKNRPCRIHLALAKFMHQGVGPRRMEASASAKNVAATLQFYDTQRTGDEKVDGQMYWDHFWAAKTTHPIKTSMDPEKTGAFRSDNHPVSIFKHESFLIGQDTTFNNDIIPLQYTIDKFIQMQKFMKTTAVETHINNSEQIKPGGFGYASNQTDQAAGVNATVPGVEESSTAYVAYDSEIYFLIWSDIYDEGTNAADANLHPSFDLNLRARYSYGD